MIRATHHRKLSRYEFLVHEVLRPMHHREAARNGIQYAFSDQRRQAFVGSIDDVERQPRRGRE